jgi:hypothetical protein
MMLESVLRHGSKTPPAVRYYLLVELVRLGRLLVSREVSSVSRTPAVRVVAQEQQ